jgi:hypothetical protein
MRVARLAVLTITGVLIGCGSDSGLNPTTPPPPAATASPAPTGPADLAITCDKTAFDLDETPLTATCSIRPLNGFRGPVRISCAKAPAEVSCVFVPSDLTISGTATVSSDLHLERTIIADPGTTTFQAVAEGGDVKRSTDLRLTVPPACAGFFHRASYAGNCADGAPFWRCISFSDGYQWHLIPLASISGYSRESCFGMTVESSINPGDVHYRHVLGTNLITTTGSIFR